MAPYLYQFRELFDAFYNTDTNRVAPMLRRWAKSQHDILKEHRKFRHLNALDHAYQIEGNDLDSLYALSRVCDLMLDPFQGDDGHPVQKLSASQFAEFWGKLGIESREPSDYHPFWCEIVGCENGADDDAAPQIEEVLWPALLWGEMLVCRAGVRVIAGRNWLDGEFAASSPLYFAYQRNGRVARDLSHGWGSNSQWRTNFRRDYLWNGCYVFNADGAPDYGGSFLRDLSAHEWIELTRPDQGRRFFASHLGDDYGLDLAAREAFLVNRCRVNRAHEIDECWPYYDSAVWSQSAPLLQAIA